MTLAALNVPSSDPTPVFELFRGAYATELLTAAVAHLHVFEKLAAGAKSEYVLRQELGLAERAATVLFTALRAFGLLLRDASGWLELSALTREHLLPGAAFDVSDYIGLAANSPGVLEMVARLRTNRPAGAESAVESSESVAGTAFIYREGTVSAMDQEASARHLTLALAGRAKNVAPFLAERAPLEKSRVLLDPGGGTGIYSIACLQKYSALRAIVWDRPEVLKVTREMAAEYGVADRLRCVPGDMFRDPVPEGADAILLSNVLHDWDVPECRALVARCAATLPLGGSLLIHDVYLNDSLDGPLPIALYSAALFTLTEGRAYSAAEYRGWLQEVGLVPGEIIPTSIHCGILPAIREGKP